MMPVVRQAADTTQWADTIDSTVRCDWLQVTSSRIILYAHNLMLMRSGRHVKVLQDFLQVLSPCDSLFFQHGACKFHVLTRSLFWGGVKVFGEV